MEKHFAELTAQNMEASEQKCQQILSELCKGMNERVQQGEYAKSGGYKLYCKDRDNVITQYQSQPNKGIQVRNTDTNRYILLYTHRNTDLNSVGTQ